MQSSNLLSILDQHGFGKINFTTPEKIDELKQLYQSSLFDDGVNGMTVSHNRGGYERSRFIHEEIFKILNPDVKRHFPGYRFFLSHFVVKHAGNQDSFQLHQDWNIVDEEKFKSFQIWIPFDLSYPENGGMFFIPGSHHFNKSLRSGSFGIPRIQIDKSIYPYLSYARLFPGQALVFGNNTFHGSFSNITAESRICALINIVEENAQTLYYHLNKKSNTTEIYPIDANGLLLHLPQLETGACLFTEAPLRSSPAPVQNQDSLTLSDLRNWIKNDRITLDLREDYEFHHYPLIKDAELEKKVNHEGYQVIDFLTEPEITALIHLFEKYFPDRSGFKGRYNSMNHQDSQARHEIHSEIARIIKQRLELYFKDYYTPICILYSKRADGVNDTDWHTDPTLSLNQQLEPVYTIWCPVIDIDERNGVLQVVPGSHRLVNKLVSPCFDDFSPTASRSAILNKHRKSFSLKAGQGILFDARLVHGSLPNFSDRERDCIVLKVAHLGTSFISLSPTDAADLFRLYEQSDDYFFSNVVTKHRDIADSGVLKGSYFHYKDSTTDAEAEERLSAIKE